ncbi:hypothetical protein AMECASPLE_011208 [Ameca splendens]|uniref:Uncharacterized protein n=1 Tax=Ameca splendens TaxID=208324 RepID=A0ABV0Y185_9TELE
MKGWPERHSTLMSLCWQTDINSSTGSESVIRSRDHMHKLSTNESLFVFLVFIHKKGTLRYKHCLTFSLRPAEANCVPESSLKRRGLYEAEWSGFPSLKGQQESHHHGNVQLGRPDSEPSPPTALEVS